MTEQDRLENYEKNKSLSHYLGHLEGRDQRFQTYYAFFYLDDAITKALSRDGNSLFRDRTFLERLEAAHVQAIIDDNQYEECKSLYKVKQVFDMAYGSSSDKDRIDEICSGLKLFVAYPDRDLEKRLRYVTSAHVIASDVFQRWVV